MKKLSILVASVAVALGFSSCETSHDDNPVLAAQEGVLENVDYLNTPVMQNEYILLTQENESAALNLTCSQPKEYGYAASVRYVPEISLTEDFATSRLCNDNWSSVCSEISITNRNVAEYMCEALGVETAADLPQDYMPLYVRLVANLYTNQGALIEGHTIISNVVAFNYVRINYLAVWVKDIPVDLFLVGTINDWTVGDPTFQFHTGAEKNTWETAKITIPAGSGIKVSPSAWNADFNGAPFNAGNNGSPIEIDVDYELNVDKDSGDISCPEGFNGVARITLNGAGKYILRLIPD